MPLKCVRGLYPGLGADIPAETGQRELVVVKEQPAEEQVVETQTAVVNLVEAGSQEVLHQVHFTMEVDGTTQEQQVSVQKASPVTTLGTTARSPSWRR